MPTYEFKCQAVIDELECGHEWEEYLSIKAPDPDECPKCHTKGKVLHLISGGSKGTVELYGQDLVDKIKADAKKMKADAAKDEKIYANLLGEDRYQQLQTQMDQRKRR